MKQEKYGFVYIWFDRKHKRYYIGCRWGKLDDGYICSSTHMNRAIKRRPTDFKRRILKCNILDRNQLLEEEFRYLSMIKKEELGKRYYNLHNHHYGHWTNNPETLKTVGQKISESHKANPNWGKWGKGVKRTEETIKKIKAANNKQFSNPDNVKLHSDITKEMWKDPEYRAKLVAAHSGRIDSKETINKRADSIRGRKFYNNGIIQKMYYPGNEPENWILGRLTVAWNKGIPHTNEQKQKLKDAWQIRKGE